MDATTIAIILMVVGLVLLIIEALTPGFFALIPGAILVVIGVIGYFVDDFFNSAYLVVVVIVVTLVVSLATIRLYQSLAKPEPPVTTVTESMIGKTGLVTVRIDPSNIKGKVRIGSDTWSATAEEFIEVNTEVFVYAGEGVHLKVRPNDQK